MSRFRVTATGLNFAYLDFCEIRRPICWGLVCPSRPVARLVITGGCYRRVYASTAWPSRGIDASVLLAPEQPGPEAFRAFGLKLAPQLLRPIPFGVGPSPLLLCPLALAFEILAQAALRSLGNL